jgi:hypothetical protein
MAAVENGLEGRSPPQRADAHIHLFSRAHEAPRSVVTDDPARYAALCEQHAIGRALVVGVPRSSATADEPDNNAFIARMAAELEWVKPLANVRVDELSISRLEELAEGPFVGVAMYTAERTAATATGGGGQHSGDGGVPEHALLERVGDRVWAWLAARRWLVSVNDVCVARGSSSAEARAVTSGDESGREGAGGGGGGWACWYEVVRRHPELRLLVAHLGLPPACPRDVHHGLSPMSIDEQSQQLETSRRRIKEVREDLAQAGAPLCAAMCLPAGTERARSRAPPPAYGVCRGMLG